MNTPAKNRYMIDQIHADKGTTRNNAGGGGRKKGERRRRPPAPSGRKAELRRPMRGIEGGRLVA